MRLISLIYLVLLAWQAGIAQAALRGAITYQNTGERVQAIQVTARGASPAITKATSNEEGIFILNFPNKKPGDAVTLGIATPIYDLVNHPRELEAILPEDAQGKQVRLVVCKKGERDQNAVKYYEISTEYITHSYERKQAQLSAEVAQLKTKIERAEGGAGKLQEELAALRQEKDELYQYYQAQLDNAWQLAEEFSRIDLAQADTIYQQAFALFEDGKIGEARQLLDSEARLSNLEQLHEKELEIAAEEANLAEMKEAVGKQEERLKREKEELQAGKEKEIKNFLLAAQLAEIEFDFKAAEKNLLAAVGLDSTNVDNLWKATSFYDGLNQQKRAIQFYQQALRHSKTEEQIAASKLGLGNQFYYNNQYGQTEAAYKEALEIYQRLAKDNPDRFEPDVAMTQNNLGAMYYDLNAYEPAKAAYKEALEIRKRLAKDNPDRFEPDVAMTQNNLGLMYVDLNAHEPAEAAYKQALEIYQRLARNNPERFEPYVANTQNNLGILYSKLNAYAQGEATFKQALEIRKRMALDNPERFEPDVASVQNNLGVMYADLNAYAQAEPAYKQALEIYQRLALDNPERFEPYVASAQNNLGILYSKLNAYTQTEVAYLQALKIYQHLALDNPERFEPDVAMAQNNLGILYRNLNAYAQAEAAYKEALEIYQRLALDNSERFEPYVATAQNNLGLMYADLNAYEPAEVAYKQALEIRKRLAAANPERFEPYVADTQDNLGLMYTDLNAYAQAKAAYKQALEIRKRLAVDNPDRFEPDVANTQNNLGVMYYSLNAFTQAEAAFKQALEIRKRLAKDNPERYNLDLANTLKNMGYLHKALLEQSSDLTYRLSGLEYAKQAEAALSLYATDIPLVKSYRYWIAELIAYFENVMEEDVRVQAQINKVLPLEEKNKTEPDSTRKTANQVEVVSMLENTWRQYPQNATIIARLSKAYDALAWHHLFNRHFLEAEQAARKGLDIDPSQKWINTKLALGLLFQGKYEEAEALYVKFKDLPFNGSMDFKTAFLQDLADLEAAGITHPDVEKTRELLKN